jgi:hypothetical protein
MAALRAAAKVALGASFSVGTLTGCGGNIESDDPIEDPLGSPSEMRAEPVEAANTSNNDVRSDGTDAADAAASSSPAGDAATALDAAAPNASPAECVGPVELEPVQWDVPWEAPANVTREAFDCCQAYAKDRISSTSSDSVDTDASSEDAAFANCCKAIVAWVQIDWTSYAEVDWEVRSACCFGAAAGWPEPPWEFSLCTPWGPPVPPAMDREVA